MKAFLTGISILAATGASAQAAQITTVLDGTNASDRVLHVSDAFAEPTTYDYIGQFQGTNMEVLMRFNLPALPAGSVVTGATLRVAQLDISDNNNQPMNVSAYAVLKDWVPSEVTWANYKAGTPWATAGLGAGTDREAVALDTESLDEVAVFHDFDITSQYQQWFSGAEANYGVVLLPDNPQGYIRLPEVNNVDQAGLVELVVDYDVVPEPAAMGLIGVAGLFLARRRRA